MFELFKYTQTEQKELLKSIVIICDTREQKNDHITGYFDNKKIPYISRKLNFGDYSFYVPANEKLGIQRDLWFDKKIIVERKNSLDEYASNISQERDRIKKEFSQAPHDKILLIENANYSDVINGNYRSQYSAQSYYGTLHSFWHEFNMPVMFMPDPHYSGCFIYGYFQYYLRDIIK